jgi:hypothetical protein
MTTRHNSPTGPAQDESSAPPTAPTTDSRVMWYIGFRSKRSDQQAPSNDDGVPPAIRH